MNLISNTGIQIFNKSIEINLNENFKMYFHEWFDLNDEQLKLEIAHNFPEDDIWVKKKDLLSLGYLEEGKVGLVENDQFKPYKWDDIKDDFFNEGYSLIKPQENKNGESDCFQISLNKIRWEKFENKWLPFPFFKLNKNNDTEFGPTNWCRLKITPNPTSGNSKSYNLILAFDTRTQYENDDFEDEDLNECPVFANEFEKSKSYGACNNEFSLLEFCSEARNCSWVEEHILHIFHNIKNTAELNPRKPRLTHIAQYVFLLRYIEHLNIFPKINLQSDQNVAFGNVDLTVDIGNSRTCAVLFDDSDFSKVELLALQNFTNPIVNGELNKKHEAFDMRLAFREADFGGGLIKGSAQFIYPSFIRLGSEATELTHLATNLNTGEEKRTTFSSPKRYLWDNKPQEKEWEFISLQGEIKKPLWIKGISEQLNPDGSLNINDSGGIITHYSRNALMTFAFLEILAQAKMQINSYEFRHKWGNENTPRKIGRIIVTCPTSMSKIEQVELRKCAQNASIILEKFYNCKNLKEIRNFDINYEIEVIPSAKSLLSLDNVEWTYDEATSAQFVYLYAEIKERYLKNIKEYFNFYGKVRDDLDNYNKKSLTIGSIDIGAGTTDLMIAAYKINDSEQCKLTPVPLFWESFYVAGDDLVKELIRILIIEGPNAAIQTHIEKIGKSKERAELILDFFGKDNARQSIKARQIRSEFNLQVSVPVIMHFLNILKENKIEKAVLTYDDVFKLSRPTARVSQAFVEHFGFSLESLNWNYDKIIISKIVEKTFDSIVGKISAVLAYYGCDIVLLSGRPTSLKPLSDLFLKYYSVPPNRLITMNNYRVGTWYPFHNGKGYFTDGKSIVTVGAMIGNFASKRGSLGGFNLDLTDLIEKMKPTSEYFTKTESDNAPFITPTENKNEIVISQMPFKIWTRQLNTNSYPTRPFYILDFNRNKIEERIINKYNLSDLRQIKLEVDKEIERIKKLSPYTFSIERENYLEDKEKLNIELITDSNQDELPLSYFSLQIQSMTEIENYWLDTGEFSNLYINN